MSVSESDIFISGSDISGLYTAILLCKSGLNVHIIDKKNNRGNKKRQMLGQIIILSPRTLQLLQQLDVLPLLLERGVRHSKIDLYENKGSGNQATTISRENIRLWENDITEFNYALSCEKAILCDILEDHLESQFGVRVDYKQSVTTIEDISPTTPNDLCTNDLNLYYQYRPLPSPNTSDCEKTLKLIQMNDVDTRQLKLWKSHTIIGTDDQTDMIRQKLGFHLKPMIMQTRIFYTLKVKVLQTNYPSTKQMSIINKNKDILFITGHNDCLYITFEPRSRWTKVCIDDEVPVQRTLRHIKYVMDPYNIEFGKVEKYTRWEAKQSICHERSEGMNYFFLSKASQHISPGGTFDVNLDLELTHNLAWKLSLSYRNRASPELLDTFDHESQMKTEEASTVSYHFLNLIGNYFGQQSEDSSKTGVNSSYMRDLTYFLKKYKSCFVGDSPYTPNLLNNVYTDDRAFLRGINDSGSTFEFIPPSQHPPPVQFVAGCLAPDAKLKPYTLFQLLLITPSLTKSPAPQTQLKSEDVMKHQKSTSTELKLKAHNSTRRTRSNSVTLDDSMGSSGSIWSVLPLFQKNSNQAASRKNSTCSTNTKKSISDAASLASNEPWKRIRTNHYKLLNSIQGIPGHHPLAFTILVFCGSICDPDTFDRVLRFRKYMDSPISFMIRYDQSPELITSVIKPSSSQRLSMSSVNSASYYRKSASIEIPRESFDSEMGHSLFSTSSANTSTTTTSSSSFCSSQSLFSTLYITSSSKNDCLRYLSSTPPAIVHSTFPCGLNKVFLDHDQQCYKSYAVQTSLPEVIIIRPDGYIGTRVPIYDDVEESYDCLSMYFDSFLRPPVDMNTAAAFVAASYDC
ncbi:hypothetical protein BDB01DRAFT_896439 [Pilobolus umbonatus]|nr:hypothetical protein BDB01DRAFT_896439 [Pilobolus umbonatus]